MPYISPKLRAQVAQEGAETPGELNYEITLAVRRYLKRKGLAYQTINDILGALEGAKAEFYRRVASPYEQNKCNANGDVYP